MSLVLESKTFDVGAHLPQRFAHPPEGNDTSPEMRWSDPPEGTRSFALICEDPDAPTERPFVHWLLWDIPADKRELAENEGAQYQEGSNDFDEIGWAGPLPPEGHGVHRYYFRLYALDTRLELEVGADRQALQQAIEGHVLASAETVGCFSR